MSAHPTARLEIDLNALAANYRTIQARQPAAEIAPVVKADGYGLGAAAAARHLVKHGAKTFFVARRDEGVRLRAALGGGPVIYVLDGLDDPAVFTAHDLRPVLNTPAQAALWTLAPDLKAALHIDTGMNRLGIRPDELPGLPSLPALSLVMSHLACADEPDHEANAVQLAAMRKATERFPGVPVCFANSGGIFLGTDYHNALMRPGIALYGGAPSAAHPNPMKPVVSLSVAVVQTRTVPAESFVGYGASLRTTQETRLATIAAGYADGLPRSLSGRGAAYFNGVRLPVAGRVSMDSITLDISALPEGTLTHGSVVEIIGPNQSLEEIAEDAGTIAYEILTRLGQRYRRHYIYPEKQAAASSTITRDK